MKEIKYDLDKCVGCFACVLVCPLGAIEATDNDKVIIDSEICVECGDCINCCPTLAFSWE